jgi:7,8-dihydropterin-6-yl-methyl-4-(beta-D-ribofuranosyl)aminobenzene 5'-phosphate synthase
MTISIWTLSENTSAKPGFAAEWGLSVLIRVDDLDILFDTGANTAAVENAKIFPVELRHLHSLVLSHGHADHTGGLRQVLKAAGPKKIFAHPDIWRSKYTKRPYQDSEAYIGIPFARQELESLGASFTFSKKPQQITKNVMTTGEVPMVTKYEAIEPNLLVSGPNGMEPDPLDDDLSLIITSEKGLIVILGCAHRGMINHILHARKLTGVDKVYAVIGGTHLGPASEERLRNAIRDLHEMDVKKIGVSHCTGFHAAAELERSFKDNFFLNNAGTYLMDP